MFSVGKRRDSPDTTDAGTGPHDAVSEAFALDEPFVEKEDGGRVEHGTANGVENALGEDDVPDAAGEGGDEEREDDGREAGGGAVGTEFGPLLQGREGEGGTEIHYALSSD